MVAWSFRIIQPLFKNQNSFFFKNHKKSKLCHKVIIFISLESSCVSIRTQQADFLFSILLSSYLDFCENFLKKIKKNSKKIMMSDMGILRAQSDPLWPLYKYP